MQLIIGAGSNHAIWEVSFVIHSWICQSLFLEGHNLRLFNYQINLIYDCDVAKTPPVSACHNRSLVLLLHNPSSHAVTRLRALIQLRAYPASIITNFQLNHSTSSWSHKHNYWLNGKAANNLFMWHLDNRKSKVKLFPMSIHIGNSGLHWSLWKKYEAPKVIMSNSDSVKHSQPCALCECCALGPMHNMPTFSKKAVLCHGRQIVAFTATGWHVS